MPGRKIGTLVVVVAKARNLPHHKVGKQDLYCELKLGDQTVRTKAVKRGGQNPEWDEEFRFPIYETAEEELEGTWRKRDGEALSPRLKYYDWIFRRPSKRIMRLSCYADSSRKPGLIGESTIDLTETLKEGELDGYFELTSPTFYRGEVYLEMTYYWSEVPRPPNQPDSQRSAWRKSRPDTPPISSDRFQDWADWLPSLNPDILPDGRDAMYLDDPRYGSHSGRSQPDEGVSPSHDEGVSSGLFGPRRPTIISVSEVERIKPRVPRRIPSTPIQRHQRQASLESVARGSSGTPSSADEISGSFPTISISDPASAGPKSLQTSLGTDVPLPQGQDYSSSTPAPPRPLPTPPSSGLLQYQPHQIARVGTSYSHPLSSSTSMGFHQPAPATVILPLGGSSFSDSMTLVDDIGFAITWISPVPVKVNGHFCDVFEGIHVKVGKVALKRPRIGATGYDDVVVRRFEREAVTWRKLRHPHILKFLGTFKRDGHIYFVSPFISNGTLVEYIAARPDMNRIQLLCETADAVQYLHKEGVVHGDLKANNILIHDGGHALLCDFGLTRTVESRTSTAMRGAGTFRWQSPELWDNAPKSFESDVYAFGMTIAEVLTGEVPFYTLTNDVAVMCAVVLRDERPPKIPAESSSGMSYKNVWDVASACWPKAPSDRISMSEALRRIQMDPSRASRQQS